MVLHIVDHQGDELFRELIGTVVVGAARNGHRQAVGAVVRQRQQICARLGAAVRRARAQRAVLGKPDAGCIQRQVAVHLVGGHLMEMRDAVRQTGVHQRRRAENVGAQKDLRLDNRAVDMRLGRKIDHHIGAFRREQAVDRRAVADVRPVKPEMGVRQRARQRGQIARIGQAVRAHNAVRRMVRQQIIDEIRADKSRAAGNHNRSHAHSLFFPASSKKYVIAVCICRRGVPLYAKCAMLSSDNVPYCVDFCKLLRQNRRFSPQRSHRPAFSVQKFGQNLWKRRQSQRFHNKNRVRLEKAYPTDSRRRDA